MSNLAGLSVADEEIIETVLRMLRSSDSTEAASLLRSSRWRFEETGYDNWNGGTRIYTLYVEIVAEVYATLDNRRDALKKNIEERLTEVVGQLSTDWYHVELVPLIVTIAGRPDLRGGPVSRDTREKIVAFLQKHGFSWHGERLQTEFLSEIYDLETLPSGDRRFGTASGDIWQHCVMNDDWPQDWVYRDKRLNLLEGPDDKFLRFLEMLIDPAVRPDKAEASRIVEGINRELRRDGWTLIESNTLGGGTKFRIVPSHAAFDRADATLRHTAVVLNSAWMHQEIERIESAVDSDPALAIGTAKELIETCCKHIAEDLGLAIRNKADVPELVKVILKELQLVPEGIAESKKGADAIKRILRNFAQLTYGLAELRNLYGSGHGREPTHRGLQPRHARLAVSAAAAFTEFVVATFNVRRRGVSQTFKREDKAEGSKGNGVVNTVR